MSHQTPVGSIPAYLMLVLTPYRTYYQSGLVIDNSTGFRNFLLAVPDHAPDYVLTNTPADYVAGTSLENLSPKILA